MNEWVGRPIHFASQEKGQWTIISANFLADKLSVLNGVSLAFGVELCRAVWIAQFSDAIRRFGGCFVLKCSVAQQ